MVERGIALFRVGDFDEFEKLLSRAKAEHPLAYKYLLFYRMAYREEFAKSLKVGLKLLAQASGEPWISFRTLHTLGFIYRKIGEPQRSLSFYEKAKEMARRFGEENLVHEITVHQLIVRFFLGDYPSIVEPLRLMAKKARGLPRDNAEYFLLYIELVLDGPSESLLRKAKGFLGRLTHIGVRSGLLEFLGTLYRMLGRLDEAMECYLEATRGELTLGSPYAIGPLARAFQLARLAGMPLPKGDLVKRSFAVAKKGSHTEWAALKEAQALSRLNDYEASVALAEAAEEYLKGTQRVDAVMAGSAAAALGWRSDSPGFPRAVKFLSKHLPYHPGFYKDYLVGGLLSDLRPLFRRVEGEASRALLRAKLAGPPELAVAGRGVDLSSWHNKKAALILLYLLLVPGHRAESEHLTLLLWPHLDPETARNSLFTAVSYIRRRLGVPKLLARRGRYYELREVWTDLDELENLLVRAQVSEGLERERLLARARELAGPETLLEGFDDVPYAEEYRRKYERLRASLGLPG